MLIKKIWALHKRLWMWIHSPYIRNLCTRKSHQTVVDAYNLLPNYIIVVFNKQIIVFRYNTGWRILYRKHCIISLSAFDILHGILPGIHVVAITVLAKVCLHGKLWICTLNSLKHNPCIGKIQAVYLSKVFLLHYAMLSHKLILLLSTGRHNLFKKLNYTVLQKLIICKRR